MRWLREPLVQFLLIGAVLFVVFDLCSVQVEFPQLRKQFFVPEFLGGNFLFDVLHHFFAFG